MKQSSAIFIMPRASTAWKGSEALWITAAGWAKAAERKLGKGWVVTTDRVATADEVIQYPLATGNVRKGSGLSGYVPEIIITGLKDWGLYRTSKRFNKQTLTGPWKDDEVKFVWEQHDLFNGQGRKLASELGVPLISYVHAPTVWEAAKWGIRRPFWGGSLEHQEARSLNQADLVACVSDQVKEKLITMGVTEDRILVSPMSVDARRFQVNPQESRTLRESLGLTGKKIIGWTGSFRGFHGLDTVLHAFHKARDQNDALILLLVGDGKLKTGTMELANKLGIQENVIFAGRQPFEKIPMYVSIFDIAIVSAANSESFHYSPLKLREYLAAGIPTIAPDAGEVPRLFTADQHLTMYRPENEEELTGKILALAEDDQFAEKLGMNGRNFILEKGTWDAELQKSLNFLKKAGKY